MNVCMCVSMCVCVVVIFSSHLVMVCTWTRIWETNHLALFRNPLGKEAHFPSVSSDYFPA